MSQPTKITRLLIDLDSFVLEGVDQMALDQKRKRKNMIEIIVRDAVK